MMTSQEIRKSYTDFFASKKHQIVPSAPMVIKGDPTLMFTNAGMNQFKDIILGNTPIKYPRVADSQKCLRVSGKHNDLEEVGHDTYHHTMFEMLGNWSFGDYFKKEAIEWAWEYLTEVIKLDKNRLYVTVFEGSPQEGLPRDNEAASFWAKHLPENRIINGNKKDNFWEMGDTGPCGPCSEIHIDLRPLSEREQTDGLTLINKNHPQVIEIWNLVFMQFNRKADGSLENLPAKVIDTGMGFERLCMAVQGKLSNYDTDLFQPIIVKIGEITHSKYGQDSQKDIAMRVIADHIRTIAFSITDGQLPSNAKAGYVIRRILRRAVRYGYTFLGMKQPFMYRLIPTLIQVMGTAYPELNTQKKLIEKVIKEEEDSFLHTLETGIKLLDKQISELKKAQQTKLSGSIAFQLYDTYGFPLDLTELILREHQMEADTKEFQHEMQKQKERARQAATMEAGDWVILQNGETHFTGYDHTEGEAKILKYREVRLKNKTLFQIVFDHTPFYAEMGGQVGDQGNITSPTGETIPIIDTKRENNLPIHLTHKLPQDPTQTFTLTVDTQKRIATECNHSATHLLHQALREILGTHVEQKGSFVGPDILRFDFAHFQKLTDLEIRAVEQLVNKKIRENHPLEENRNIPIAQAKKMGAMALFGEKYGEQVRTIRFGTSIELCGGTHTKATGNIGLFKIVSESAIAAGVRRIEAVTAQAAEQFLYTKEDILKELKNIFHNTPDLAATIKKFIDDNQELKKQVESFLKEKAQLLKEKIIQQSEQKNGVRICSITGEIPTPIIKDIAFELRSSLCEPMAFIAATIDTGKPHLCLMLSEHLVAQGKDASTIVREAAKHIQGGGGGQKHFATAGGKNSQGLDKAFETLISKI